MAIEDLMTSVRSNFLKQHKESPGGEIIFAKDEKPTTGMIVDNPLFEYILDRRFLAYGRCYLVYGKKGSCKTSLALDIMKQFQKAGGYPIWIETEQAADLDYAEKQGLDKSKLVLDNKNLTLEEVLDKIKLYVRNLVKAFPEGNTPVCIVMDSMAGICPEVEMAENVSVGDVQMCYHAKLASKFYRNLIEPLSNEKAIFVMINQLKDKIGGFQPNGPGEALIGGEAQRFYSTYQWKMSTTGPIEKTNEHGAKRKIGSYHEIRCGRNKLGREGSTQKIEFPMLIQGGIQWYPGLVDFLAKEYHDLVHDAGRGNYLWIPEGMKATVEGEEVALAADTKYSGETLGTLIQNCTDAKELIRKAFEIPALPSKEEWEEIENERKKKRGKKVLKEADELPKPKGSKSL